MIETPSGKCLKCDMLLLCLRPPLEYQVAFVLAGCLNSVHCDTFADAIYQASSYPDNCSPHCVSSGVPTLNPCLFVPPRRRVGHESFQYWSLCSWGGHIMDLSCSSSSRQSPPKESIRKSKSQFHTPAVQEAFKHFIQHLSTLCEVQVIQYHLAHAIYRNQDPWK